ncbi:MAG TPA: Hsp20/alpha crystallin family protein [Nitrospira sp.]|nr:Hsp20/alpha crystallin family protein [Nitrospira sp.]
MTSYIPAALSSIGRDGINGQIDQLFDEALRGFGQHAVWVPASNVWEDDSGFYVQLALPGWEPKDVTIEVDKQILKVTGSPNEVEAEPIRKVYLWQTTSKPFERRFRLPNFVNQEKASATHKHGLLIIAFPKREEAKPRRIEIQG